MDPQTIPRPAERPRRLDEAEAVLRQAGKQLGDTADLRLARMRLAVARGGVQVVTALNELGRGLEKFSRPERSAVLDDAGPLI